MSVQNHPDLAGSGCGLFGYKNTKIHNEHIAALKLYIDRFVEAVRIEDGGRIV
jgi:hypothetical protein